MSTINVHCVDQVMTITNSPVISSGDVGVDTLAVNFCSAWNGYEKTATFYRDENHVYYAVLDENGTCVIPHEVLAVPGTIFFGIFGVNSNEQQRTTEIIRYKIVKGAITEDLEPSDPTPDIYTQLLSKYAEIIAGISGKANKVSNATAGNFAGLNASGDLSDSGKKASDFHPEIPAISAVSALADDDYFPLYDVSATAHKKTLWSNIKAKLKTYFDTLYALASHTHTKSQITDFPSSLPASDVYSWAKAAEKPSYTASEVDAAASSHSHGNITNDGKISGVTLDNTLVKLVGSALNTLGGAAVSVPSIASGSYIGTGTYGQDNPCTLNFSFTPKLVIIYESDMGYLTGFDSDDREASYTMIAAYGATMTKLYGKSYGASLGDVVLNCTWGNTSFSWYFAVWTSRDASGQFNQQGTTYNYMAIG